MNINSTVVYSSICCQGIVGIGTVDASIKCENDSKCLFTKCIDDHCVNNKESPV